LCLLSPYITLEELNGPPATLLPHLRIPVGPFGRFFLFSRAACPHPHFRLPPPKQITLEELNVMDRLPHYCPICAFHEWNLDGLVEMCWDYLDLVRHSY
jgi:hypothetical protein